MRKSEEARCGRGMAGGVRGQGWGYLVEGACSISEVLNRGMTWSGLCF